MAHNNSMQKVNNSMVQTTFYVHEAFRKHVSFMTENRMHLLSVIWLKQNIVTKILKTRREQTQFAPLTNIIHIFTTNLTIQSV